MLTQDEIDLVMSVFDVADPASNCAIGNDEIEKARGLFAMIVEDDERLRALINTPSTEACLEAVMLEAAHQVDRWGSEHDAGKRREDWITLLSYLLGKVALAHFDRDDEKLKHRIVTIAAACLNWLRAENGESTKMRPGIDRGCVSEP